jgi:hypothetical protein
MGRRVFFARKAWPDEGRGIPALLTQVNAGQVDQGQYRRKSREPKRALPGVGFRHSGRPAMTKVLDSRSTPAKDSALGGAAEQLQRLLDEDRKNKIQIALPAQGASLVLPIDMEATWIHPIKPGTFRATVNGSDVTSLFAVDEAAMKATAHGARIGDPECTDNNVMEDIALVVSADLFKNLPKPGYYRSEASAGFKIAGPAYAIIANATDLQGLTVHPGYMPYYQFDVARGSTEIIRIAVVSYNAFLGDVEIKAYASRPPAAPMGSSVPGITFNTHMGIFGSRGCL